MSVPRFLLDEGFVANLANVDTSFGECARDGRLTIHVDYRRGQPLSAQLVRVPLPVSFKIHLVLGQTESA